jgi:mitochondrial fission protein ELM1
MLKSADARSSPVERRSTPQPLVWLLMGNRAGDNNQLLALADALGFPFETKQLAYNSLRHLPYVRRSVAILAPDSRALIQSPWPDLVMGVGHGSVPVARYIRRQTDGRARLVHIGNPRGALPDFDLQITTPQYSREAPNLLELHFPIGNPAKNAQITVGELEWQRSFSSPLRLVAVGGSARNWELDHDLLARAIGNVKARRPEGSLIIAVSPRTSVATRRLLERLVLGTSTVIIDSSPSFGTLLAMSDEIFVTADSVSMLSEAILSGKPVGLIPIRRSLRGRIVHRLWERPIGRPTFPDFGKFWDLLRRRGLIGTVEDPIASTAFDTVEPAAAAVRAVLANGHADGLGR